MNQAKSRTCPAIACGDGGSFGPGSSDSIDFFTSCLYKKAYIPVPGRLFSNQTNAAVKARPGSVLHGLQRSHLPPLKVRKNRVVVDFDYTLYARPVFKRHAG